MEISCPRPPTVRPHLWVKTAYFAEGNPSRPVAVVAPAEEGNGLYLTEYDPQTRGYQKGLFVRLPGRIGDTGQQLSERNRWGALPLCLFWRRRLLLLQKGNRCRYPKKSGWRKSGREKSKRPYLAAGSGTGVIRSGMGCRIRGPSGGY